METLDHKTDPTKLWRTIKAIDGKSTPKAENEAITFDGCQVSSPNQIANYFKRQFTTSKLGRHISSRETRLVSREIKRKSLTSAVTFTTDQFTKGISSFSNTRAFGLDKLSIFHLKHLGSRANFMEAFLLPNVNNHLLPSADQHGFRPGHYTISVLLQMTSDIATGFNQRKPPHRTVCVAVDLPVAFDTVNHNVLLSKIVRSTLPEAICRWLSNYLRGRQSVTSCRCVKVKGKDSPHWRTAIL